MDTKKISNLIDQLKTRKIAMHGKDFLLTWEKSRDELEATFLVADALRAMREAGISPRLWDSGIAVSNFRDNSTRTRFSFASACNPLGLYVGPRRGEEPDGPWGDRPGDGQHDLLPRRGRSASATTCISARRQAYMREVAPRRHEGSEGGVLQSASQHRQPAVRRRPPHSDHGRLSPSEGALRLTRGARGKKIAMSWAYSPSYGKPLCVPQGIIGLATPTRHGVVLAHPEGYELIPEVR